MEIIIAKYRNHPIINAITEKIEKLGNPTFGFGFTSYKVNNLKIRKVSQKTDIPVEIIKENIDILIYCITILITRCHVLPFLQV